jgi:hypothetical protein
MDLRHVLPYGKWTLKDGTEVLFNRLYQPMLRRKGSNVEPVDPSRWMEWESQEHYYDDSNPPNKSSKTRLQLEKILQEWKPS